MAGKATRASEIGARYLKNNPSATAEEVARKCGLTVSGVQKSAWWKNRNVPAGEAKPW